GCFSRGCGILRLARRHRLWRTRGLVGGKSRAGDEANPTGRGADLLRSGLAKRGHRSRLLRERLRRVMAQSDAAELEWHWANHGAERIARQLKRTVRAVRHQANRSRLSLRRR